MAAGTSIAKGTGGRWLAAAWSGFKATFGHFWRVLHQLFLEVVGFLFLCLAVLGGFAARRQYLDFRAGTEPEYKAALAAGFALMFAWFGVSSFWRARKKAALNNTR